MREFETQRLRLRRVTESDVQTIFDNWTSDPEVAKYMTWHPHKSPADTRIVMDYWISEYSKPDCYRWGIELRETGELIGMIDVVTIEEGVPVIGYCSAKRFWNHGYMTEALRAVTKELLDSGFDRLRIFAVQENKASNRVIQKAGFTYVDSRSVPQSPVKPDIVTLNHYELSRS